MRRSIKTEHVVVILLVLLLTGGGIFLASKKRSSTSILEWIEQIWSVIFFRDTVKDFVEHLGNQIGNGIVQALSELAIRAEIAHISLDISPSGDKVVFVGSGVGSTDLYLLDLVSLKVTRLTETSAREASPRFSPDGKWIVYSASSDLSDSNPTHHLFIYSLNENSTEQLTSEPGTIDYSPRFIVGGKQILFVRRLIHSDNDKKSIQERNYLLDLHTGQSTPLNCPFLGTLRPDGNLMICPSDETESVDWLRLKIVFQPLAKQSEMQTVNIVIPNTLGRVLAHNLVSGMEAEWSPNGRQIVLTAINKDGEYEIWLVDTVRWTGRLVAKPKHYIQSVRLTPDGKRILFLMQSERAASKLELWQLNVQSGNLSRVADHRLFDDPLNWKRP